MASQLRCKTARSNITAGVGIPSSVEMLRPMYWDARLLCEGSGWLESGVMGVGGAIVGWNVGIGGRVQCLRYGVVWCCVVWGGVVL